MRRLLIYILVLAICSSCRHSKVDYHAKKFAASSKAMVVSAHPLSTEIGTKILAQGGNAVDASIATQLALAVVYPRAGNLGGGGFMLYRNKNNETVSLDFREKAPLSAHREMYLDSLKNVIPGASTLGHLAVGVPGTPDGLFAAFEKYSKLRDFKKLIQPSIELAKNGFKITGSEADRLNKFKSEFLKVNAKNIPFIKDELWKEGDLLVQKELSESLERIRDHGRAGFYEGKTAEFLLREMTDNNGLIQQEDLNKYKSNWREPIKVNFGEFEVLSMPPPSSGGIVLGQMLKMLEEYDLQSLPFHSPQAIHLIAEIERRAYSDRAKHMGDSDFYPVQIDSLLSKSYLLSKMSNFDKSEASESEDIMIGNFKAKETYETTHISIVDAEGNAVSLTTTLNSNYGSKVYVEGAGFFLNNEMDDFSSKPGVPNLYGLVGGEANAIEGEKRMLSSMCPTIVTKNNNLYLVLGTPGGSTIITTVFQVFINMSVYNMSIEKAVNSCRFHHQWLPDRILIEDSCFDTEVLKALKTLGHDIEKTGTIAKIKAIHLNDSGMLEGVGDFRNPDDHAAGF